MNQTQEKIEHLSGIKKANLLILSGLNLLIVGCQDSNLRPPFPKAIHFLTNNSIECILI